MLQIVVADDGHGIDVERLRAKVVERGLTTAKVAAQLTEAELFDFLFLPGFSTKEHVTEVSGRGVGLECGSNDGACGARSIRVVSRQARKRDSYSNCQSPFLSFEPCSSKSPASHTPFLEPHRSIFMLDRNDLRELEGKQQVMLDDQPLGLVEAARVFDLPSEHTPRVG